VPDGVLIPSPVLDPSTEVERIAARLDRTIGVYTIEDAELLRSVAEELIRLLENGLETEAIDKLVPELSSVRASEAHTAMLTEMERALSMLVFALNQLPEQNRIALYQILGITLQPDLAATTTLQFTKTAAFLNQDVTLPAGVLVATQDRAVRVTTDEELLVPSGDASGIVAATSVVAGDIGRTPAGTLSLLLESVAGIESVTNTSDLSGGRNGETTAEAEIRAREEMRQGIHRSTGGDWEDHIKFEILRRKGRVTAFEQYLADFSLGGLGYLLLVVQDELGLAPSETTMAEIGAAIAERHVAGIQVTARPPEFLAFDIEADVTIRLGSSASALKTRAGQSLRDFYSPLVFRFGPSEADRFISISDIVGLIESAGRDEISVKQAGGRFSVSIIVADAVLQDDVPLAVGELPTLGLVTLNVVS
jgi:uncharacterized phage protein gp47/JayE